MKRFNKLTAWLLTLAMLMTLLPGFTLSASAAEPYNLWVGGVQVTSDKAANVFGDDKVSYDAGTSTLTLDGYTYEGTGYNDVAIYYSGSSTLNLVLVGESSVTHSGNASNFSYGVYANGSITVSGDGTLTATGGNASNFSYGVKADSITISGGSLTATGSEASNSYGVNADSFTISGGEVVAKSVNFAFYKAPIISETFTNAAVWYGDTEAEANNYGAKSIADLASNYNAKYVKVAEEIVAEGIVACVTTGEIAKYCNSINEAIDAAQENEGSTLRLLNNIDAEVDIEGGTFTIDLNGKTWQSSSTLINIKNNANVTINDRSLTGTGILYGTGNTVIDIRDSAVLKLLGGTIEGNSGIGYYNGEIDLSDYSNPTGIKIHTGSSIPENPTVKLPQYYILFIPDTDNVVTTITENMNYIVGKCNHVGGNIVFENGFCACGYYEPAVLKDGVYEISNAGQLFWFAEFVNNNSTNGSFNAILTKDINLEEKEWMPIGNGQRAYEGHFNGNGYTVSGPNITVNESYTNSYLGFFGCISGAGIRNLSVDGSIEYKTLNELNVGLLVGDITDSIVYNCYTSGSISESGLSDSRTGGLVGAAKHSAIINCGSEANVKSPNCELGGLVGFMTAGYDEAPCLLNSYSTGNVEGGSPYTGGLVGLLEDDAVNNYFAGSVNGSGVLFGMVDNNIVVDGNNTTFTFTPDIEKNYYTSGTPIGNIADDLDATGYTQQYASSEELLSELNSNLGIIEEIISGHRGYLKESQWAELVDLLDGESVKASHWRLVGDKVVHCSGIDGNADYICDICSRCIAIAFAVEEYNAETSIATVAIPTAGTYTLIFADYEETRLNNVDTVTFTADKVGIISVPSEIDITLGKDDKIMLWQVPNLVPLCDAYIVE